jgi:hypothetical protein
MTRRIVWLQNDFGDSPLVAKCRDLSNRSLYEVR